MPPTPGRSPGDSEEGCLTNAEQREILSPLDESEEDDKVLVNETDQMDITLVNVEEIENMTQEVTEPIDITIDGAGPSQKSTSKSSSKSKSAAKNQQQNEDLQRLKNLSYTDKNKGQKQDKKNRKKKSGAKRGLLTNKPVKPSELITIYDLGVSDKSNGGEANPQQTATSLTIYDTNKKFIPLTNDPNKLTRKAKIKLSNKRQRMVEQNRVNQIHMAKKQKEILARSVGGNTIPNRNITNSSNENSNQSSSIVQIRKWGSLQNNQAPPTGKPRPIILDGSNVAIAHYNQSESKNRNKVCFSSKGLEIAINYFKDKGHTDITVILPAHRKFAPKDSDNKKTIDFDILKKLQEEGYVKYCPSRKKYVHSANEQYNKVKDHYDDLFMIQLSTLNQGVIVSNDQYTDVHAQAVKDNDTKTKEVIEKNVLTFMFVGDHFMPSMDPLPGVSLDRFLRERD